jgi:hypothetical protein
MNRSRFYKVEISGDNASISITPGRPVCIKKCARKLLKPALRSHSSDYTAALEAALNTLHSFGELEYNKLSIHKVATRLNSAIKASQNCA